MRSASTISLLHSSSVIVIGTKPKIISFTIKTSKFCRFFNDCDGVIHGSTLLYEGKSFGAWKKWIGDRPNLVIGPFSFSDTTALKNERDGTQGGAEVEGFLDDALDKYGENSLVYVGVI